MSTWFCSFSDVTVTSKYCIQYMNYKLPEGCYVMSADQGYIKRCYCYSHWCNAASKNSNRTLVMAVVQVAFVAAMLSWIRGSWSRVIFIVVRIVKIRQLYTLYIPVDNILRSVIVCWCKKCENIKVSRIVILHNGVHGYIFFLQFFEFWWSVDYNIETTSYWSCVAGDVLLIFVTVLAITRLLVIKCYRCLYYM